MFNPGKDQYAIIKIFSNRPTLLKDHHPKEGERLKFIDCYTAEQNDQGVNDDTSRWVIGAFDGQNP